MALLLSAGLLAGCSDNKDDSEPTLTASELLQTTWDVCVRDYDTAGKEILNERYQIVQFLTETEGKSIRDDYPIPISNLYYQIDGRIITFENNHPLNGIWTVIEKSKNRMVLQCYRPGKSVATWTKQY